MVTMTCSAKASRSIRAPCTWGNVRRLNGSWILAGTGSGPISSRIVRHTHCDPGKGVATSTAGLLGQIRAPLAKDITDLSALTANLSRNSKTIQDFLQQLPNTVAGLIRTGSYGSWFNFYLCSISADLELPNGARLPIPVNQPHAARCQG